MSTTTPLGHSSIDTIFILDIIPLSFAIIVICRDFQYLISRNLKGRDDFLQRAISSQFTSLIGSATSGTLSIS